MLSLSDLTFLFCHIDDFCQQFEPTWKAHLLQSGEQTRRRTRSLCTSEVLTILIAFHQSGFRTFKTFYTGYVCHHLRAAFPGLVSYNRFVEFIASAIVPLFAYLRSLFGKCSGISFIDSTALAVCDNHRVHTPVNRINQHKVFTGVAKRSKTSTGWFFGFKLHLVVSDTDELLNLTLTTGNTDDRQPTPQLLRRLFGKVFGDKGYISKTLADLLLKDGVELITKRRKNMKEKVLPLVDRLLLRKRAIIESVVDQLKNISPVEHTRHRANTGFLWNVAAALIAYCHQPKKPSLNLNLTALTIVA